MAPFHSLLLSLVLFTSFVFAAPWIVTEFYQEDTRTISRYYNDEAYTTTEIQQITPTVTSMPEALSTVTSVQTGYLYSDITIVQELYPSGVGEEEVYHYGSNTDSTIFVVDITYSAPSRCSTQWTTTSAVRVTPPVLIVDDLPTTSMSTSVSVNNDRAFQPTTYTYDVVWVDPTQLPSSSLSYYSRISRPTSRYEGPGCSYYDEDDSTTSSSNGGYTNNYYDDDYNGDDWFMDNYYMGISPFALTMILIFGWIGLWLILGFIEAWVRFRRLMTGWQTHRGLPICWALTIMPFTLFFLCFCRRRGHLARTAGEAAILKEKWNDMSAWTRLRLFFAWGFRYKYPTMLGPAPPRVDASKRPGKHPDLPQLQPQPLPYPQPIYQSQGPPAGPVSREPEADRSVVSADPEMGQVPASESHQRGPTPGPSGEPSAEQYTAVSPVASGALPGGQDHIGRAQ